MRLLAELFFPGWRLRNHLNERMHWAARRRANIPPLPMIVVSQSEGTLVNAPHPARYVQVIRVGPKELDDDGLHASIKPVLDRLKCKRVGDQVVDGFIYDDSPTYCKSAPEQRIGKYDVYVLIYEGTEGD